MRALCFSFLNEILVHMDSRSSNDLCAGQSAGAGGAHVCAFVLRGSYESGWQHAKQQAATRVYPDVQQSFL